MLSVVGDGGNVEFVPAKTAGSLGQHAGRIASRFKLQGALSREPRKEPRKEPGNEGSSLCTDF